MTDITAANVRALAPQVLSALLRRFRDFAAAEDALQEALLAAAQQWPVEGSPDNPRAWLIRVAARRLSDQRRSEGARRRRETALAHDAALNPVTPAVDAERSDEDTLLLLFMCCHPALTRPSAIALTLRAVAGLTTAEIANAFLVPEATMAQRVSRAKQAIKSSAVPFAMPDIAEREARLAAVMHVLYLVFNEGYASSIGATLQRVDLAREAIRLARAMHARLPEHTELTGLLALMLLSHARREARSGPEGELIPLDEQDRSRWDKQAITEGVALLTSALARGSVGPYQIQAAIAAVHDEAKRADDTDWPQIAALYGLLRKMTDNPMVVLNQSIAEAMVSGPERGLRALAELDDDARLRGHYRLDAVRAHLYEMAGDDPAALRHYRAAAARTASVPERNYLMARVARVLSRARQPDE